MKKSISYLLLIIFGMIGWNHASAQRTCSSHEHMEQKLQDPDFAKAYQQKQAELQAIINLNEKVPCTNPLIVPIVVHYEDGSISDQCMIDAALTQIEQLNLDFSSCNANVGDLCTWINAGCNNFGGSAGADAMPEDGACIQFCLADQNLPAGEDNIGGYAITKGDYSSDNQDANSVWNSYLNIYVGTAGGALGFVEYLGGAGDAGTTTKGASVLTNTWGSATFSGCEGVGTSTQFSNGATATHEIGHWFGLQHTFGESPDVLDTPAQSSPNYGCPTVDLGNCTSSVGDDYGGNFMDYVDDNCMFTFTDDQVTIMTNTAAAQSSWATGSISCYTLWQNGTNTYSSCASGPCDNNNPPTASFTASPNPANFCSGESGSISFTDTSSDNPTSWSWTFSGAGVSPTTSNVQNPTVTVTSAGTLTAELMALNANGNDTANETISVTELSASDPACQVQACLDFPSTGAGPYIDFNYADGCILNCAPIAITTYEVYENESYRLSGLKAGVDYTFEFCNGYNSSTWAAVITVGEYDAGANAAVPNSEIAYAAACSLTFSPPADGDYIVVISG